MSITQTENSQIVSTNQTNIAPLSSQIKLQDKKFILPNGNEYAITKIKIGGKEIDVNQLNHTQLESIAKIANQIFNSLAQLDLKRNDLNSIGIAVHSQEQTNVTAHYQSDAPVSEKIDQNLTHSIHQEFRKNFSPESLNQSSSIDQVTQSVAQPRIEIQLNAYGKSGELDAPAGPERPLTQIPATLANPSSSDSTSLITKSYTINEQEYGKQEIKREATVDQSIIFCKNMISHLKSKLQQAHPDDQPKIEAEIKFYEKSLQNAEAYKKANWLSSNYFRDQIKQGDFNQAVDGYLSAPVNMRYQELKVDGKREVGFYRVGIMSDMRNGFYSLTDLKTFQKDPKKIDSRIENLTNKLKSSKLTNNQRQSIENAINNLKIMRASPQYMEIAIRERKMVLEQQMIQLIAGQVNQNPGKVLAAIQSGKSFDLVHVALLNQKKQDLDASGWMHDERVEMEDMKEIFAEFQGKTLCFNGSGPLIDGNTIYLPNQLPKEAKTTTVTLKTAFFNTSVQGNTTNNGTQLEINHEQLNHLLTTHPDIFNEFPEVKKGILNQKETSYVFVEELLMALLSSKSFCVSLGCLSAKDRTGLVSERLMLRHLHPHLPTENKHDFDKEIFDPKGPAVQVVVENSPKFKVLKVDPRAVLPENFGLLDRIKMVAGMVMASI